EVQLPFLQMTGLPATRFVPIAVGVSGWDVLESLGTAIGKSVASVDRNALIVASSDMNHYESDQITRIKDKRAIDPLIRLDPKSLHETVRREKFRCAARVLLQRC